VLRHSEVSPSITEEPRLSVTRLTGNMPVADSVQVREYTKIPNTTLCRLRAPALCLTFGTVDHSQVWNIPLLSK
jgi:hypothetical protein